MWLRALEHLQRGIGGRQRPQRARVKLGGLGVFVQCTHRGRPGDAEVQHFHAAVFGNKDIAGLEVRMNDLFVVTLWFCLFYFFILFYF